MSMTVPFGSRDDSCPDLASSRARPFEMAPAVVYVAAAQNTYGTPTYHRALQRVTGEWPRAVVMDADACGFVSRADWHLRWPFIRDGIDCLVVLSEDDGTISRETWLELRDAADSGTRCWIVTRDGDLAPAASARFQLYPPGARTDRRWALAEVPSDT